MVFEDMASQGVPLKQGMFECECSIESSVWGNYFICRTRQSCCGRIVSVHNKEALLVSLCFMSGRWAPSLTSIPMVLLLEIMGVIYKRKLY